MVTGASGFIGSALTTRLLQDGHSLILLTHSAPPSASSPGKRWLHWTPGVTGEWEKAVDGCDGIINLAGEAIAANRWSNRRKRRIRLSRIVATGSLVDAIEKSSRKPKFLINASAIGYYGDRGDALATEESRPGDDFLARLCQEWEAEALRADELGCRVMLLRTGIVLGPENGALEQMLMPYRFFVGGPLGSGKQWMSWIHLDDEIGLIRMLIENERAQGPINATAPTPVTNGEFSKTLGRVIRRPAWLGLPAFALRVMVGEMSQMLLGSQRVLPAAAQQLGYQFQYPFLIDALENCLGDEIAGDLTAPDRSAG